MSLGDGLKAFNWITDRIDQASAWFKKKARQNEVDKINKAVDTGDDATIANELLKLRKAKEDRANSK